jgi:long-chain acyl-CoA synthetase
MQFDNFAEYVANLEHCASRDALVMRKGLKVQRLTHGELQRRSYQCARYLLDRGVQQGDRVMVVAQNSIEWIELLLGALLVGAILVPVDVQSRDEALNRSIELTSPRLIFATRSRRAIDHHAIVDIEGLDEYISKFAENPLPSSPRGDLAALIVFTSGTTAGPKGVVLTQSNLLANIAALLERIDVPPWWRLLSVLPLSHTYELTGSLTVLVRGACIYYPANVSPLEIRRSLVDFEITTVLAIPQLLTLMLDEIRQSAADQHRSTFLDVALSIGGHLPWPLRRLLFTSVHRQLGGHLGVVVTGGAPIPPEVARLWEAMGVRAVQGYGLTETSPILTVNSLDDRPLDSPGRPLANVHLRIGEDGEIQVRGPSVFHEYWQRPDTTREAFTDDGWFRTGDVGELSGGYLRIRGRLKFAIIRSSGLKVFPEDVELATPDDIESICVVGVRTASGERVCAVVATALSDEEIDRAVATMNSHLASFQHVDEWRRWPAKDFPRTRLLKVDRRQVEEWANSSAPTKIEEGVTSSDNPVAEIIRSSLGDQRASFADSDRLADIGLDSLRRLTVVSLLEKNLGVSISDEGVGPSTTIGELRRLVGEARPSTSRIVRRRWTYLPWVRLIGDGVRDHVIWPLVHHWVHLEVEGEENLRGNAPSLIIFNHSDDFDGPVIYQALPKELRRHLAVAMADDVMAEHRVLAFIVRLCFAGFEFARSEPYLPSLQYVGTLLDRGWSILIAPEGRISVTGELQEFKTGIGLLAVDLGVAVIPMRTVSLHGTVPLHARWPRRHTNAIVRIGAPLRFSAHEDYEDVTRRLRDAVIAL